MQIFTLFAAALSVAGFVGAHEEDAPASSTGAYQLVDDLTYKDFFAGFEFFSGPDPTQGFVNYQNLSSAIDKGLVGYLDDTETVFMGVDYKTKNPEGGRNAVRLESLKGWNQGLAIADIHHMPSGGAGACALWPAYWFLGSDEDGKYNWPNQGEIDVLEGVNDYTTNAVTMHTSTGCVVDNSTQFAARAEDTTPAPFTGRMATTNCDVKAEGQPKNMGCSIKAPETLSEVQMGMGDSTEQVKLPSYGEAFNNVGGGIYAMEWTSTYISVWFIPRDSPIYNEHFTGNSTSSPDPSKWGTPLAHFSGKGCDFVERFKNLRMIFNTTFCGEYAGDQKEWDKSCAAKTGAATCEAYVRDNPETFTEAYWEVKGVKWYQQAGAAKRGVDPMAFVKRANGRYQRT